MYTYHIKNINSMCVINILCSTNPFQYEHEFTICNFLHTPLYLILPNYCICLYACYSTCTTKKSF